LSLTMKGQVPYPYKTKKKYVCVYICVCVYTHTHTHIRGATQNFGEFDHKKRFLP
jgi:hypothetical protein